MTNPAPVTLSQSFDALLSALLAHYPQPAADYAAWFDALPQRERHLLVVQGLHSQVCNGGFAQWIENGYLERDLGTLALAMTRMASFSLTVPAVERLVDRAVMLADDHSGGCLPEDAYDALEPLDDAYYAMSDAFENAFQRYFVDWV
jgi:hypothetical protein